MKFCRPRVAMRQMGQGGHEADGVYNMWQRGALVLEPRPGPEPSPEASRH